MINRRQFQLACLSSLIAGSRIRELDARLAASAFADGDWTQWGGPQRDFSATPPAQTQPLPAPQLIWQQDLGPGHAAIVSEGQHAYSLRLNSDEEVLEQWDLETGRLVETNRYEVDFHASIAEYDGPHSTPLVTDDGMVTVGIDAGVHCFNCSDRSRRWNRKLPAEFGTVLPQSGYAASPLAWGQRLILPTLGNARSQETESYQPPGVGEDSIPGAVALDIRSGAEIWRSESFRSSHASPILATIDGQPTVIFHGMFELVGVDPRKGRVLWRHLLRREAADNVSFTPIWDPERRQILISHGYCDLGTQAIRLERRGSSWKTETTWTNDRLRITHTNAVRMGTTLVGTSRSSVLVAVDVRDGETVFRQRGFSKANFLNLGTDLLILDESGDLICGALGAARITERWRIRALSANAWTAPSMAGGRLLLRDLRELKVYGFGV